MVCVALIPRPWFQTKLHLSLTLRGGQKKVMFCFLTLNVLIARQSITHLKAWRLNVNKASASKVGAEKNLKWPMVG